MSGSVVDLAQAGVVLPNPLSLDSNLLITELLSSWLPAHAASRRMTARANQLFHLLQRQQVVGVVTPTALNEVLHVLIRLKFEAEVSRLQPQLQRRFPGKRAFTWSDVYKLRPYLLQRYASDLDQVVQRMHGRNLLILQPSDLGPIPGNRDHEREMLRLIRRYALDTNDVSILLEASRAGLASIASLDADLRRAQRDFDVYTWL